MSDKQLKNKAIKIKGKDYVLVADRVQYFNDTYKNGSITTKLLSDPQSETVVVYAKVIPDIENPKRLFTGHAQEMVGGDGVNKTSALENAETSAIGRALGLMGIGVIESIASADEMNKALNREKREELPWLTEEKKNSMLDFIAEGKIAEVKQAMLKYKMKKVWYAELVEAIATQEGGQANE